MDRKFLLWAMAAVIVLPTLLGVGYWVVWDQFLRFKPVTITHNQTEIQKLLDQADYVSPGHAGSPVYLITYRACVACRTYEEQEFPKFDAIGADTRVIIFARPDNQGLSQSTPVERSTIAELWLSRKWPFYLSWFASPDNAWKPDLPVADDDMARNAVVGATRDFAGRLGPLLAANGVHVGYPLILWRDSNNRLKACACSDPRGYQFIREDLGAPASVGPDANPLSNLKLPADLNPANLTKGLTNGIFKSGSESSSASSAAPAPAAKPATSAAKPAAATASNGYPADFGPDSDGTVKAH